MSSTYRIICLSHDPAVVLYDTEWHSGSGGRDEIMRVLDNTDREPIPGHERCDLVGGRFSYPLIEIYNPNGHRTFAPGDTIGGQHTGDPIPGEWVDANWLALALAAYEQPNPSPALRNTLWYIGGHEKWPAERVTRLREELAHIMTRAATQQADTVGEVS